MAMVPKGAVGTHRHHHAASTAVRRGNAAGFTLVEVVVSTGILGFALASSLGGLTRSLELLRLATARQQALNAVTLDLQRQQGLVIRVLAEVGDTPLDVCRVSLTDLRQELEAQAANLPDGVMRDLVTVEGRLLLASYTSSFPAFRRERVLAARGSAATCKDAAADDIADDTTNEDKPDDKADS